jgi:hypothetical protein
MSTGVQLPESGGQRSSSAFGRAVVADALRAADPAAAEQVLATKDWRSGYLRHFRRLIEVAAPSYDTALTSARHGLTSLHERMRYDGADGEVALLEAFDGSRAFNAVEVKGEGDRETEFSLPYRGERLRGDALQRQLDRWVDAGTIEPSCAEAVRLVVANPDWLDLSDRTVVVLGAGAEMGPLQALLRWGGNVVGIDLPRADLWSRVLGVARTGAGRLTVPVRTGSRGDLEQTAGADLITDLPQVASWLRELDGPLLLGNYVYADGVTNVRVSAGVDALTVHLLKTRDDVALSFLATPTDVFAVPPEVVEQARSGHGRRSALKAMRVPLRAVSGGRLLVPNYLEGSAVCDSLVPQQGPNYALAKRLQRWRAAVARDEGVQVSLNVAPPTRTRSVVKNRLLATAYTGARRFGVEVFEPATSNVLMAALLAHDLRTAADRVHPFAAEAQSAAHGGLWRQPYSPRSVLGLAVLVGVGGSRT